MILVIPSIDLRNGHCVRLNRGRYVDETDYYVDPIKMACLWRVQNAKILHVVDLDTDENGHRVNREVVRAICDKVDIPVEVAGGIRSMADIDDALTTGAYRVVVPSTFALQEDLLQKAIAKHGAGRIVASIRPSESDCVAALEDQGCRRIIWSDPERDNFSTGPDTAGIESIAASLTKSRVTVLGGVVDFNTLDTLTHLVTSRVDSVIIDRPIYENRFPCQNFWCWNNKESVDLEAFSSAPLESRN